MSLIWLSACSSRQDTANLQAQSLSSEAPSQGNTEPNLQASCNGISGNEFTGKIKAYIDFFGNPDDNSKIISLSQIPTAMEQSGSLQFFRWLADFNGSSLDNTPLTFILINPQSQLPLSGNLTKLSQAEMSTISQRELGQILTADEFLQKVHILVLGLTNTYDVLKLAVYGSDGSLVSETDTLVPGFFADPNAYAFNSVSILAKLHPNFNSRTSNFSQDQYLSMTNSFCF